MDITHLKHYPPEKVRALFGLTLSALGALLATVLPERCVAGRWSALSVQTGGGLSAEDAAAV